jgi:sugar diacid utilization regulator
VSRSAVSTAAELLEAGKLGHRCDDDAMSGPPADPFPNVATGPWLTAVAEDAARRTGVPADLLGAYLTLLADAALRGRRPSKAELSAVHDLGRQAAARNVTARQMAHLYLSAAAQLWSTVPREVRTRGRDAVSSAAEAVLLAVDGAVVALVEGHDVERRRMIRQAESLRQTFVDDLLRGDSDVASLVERAEPFGLDLARAHQVAVAAHSGRLVDEIALATALERSIADRFDGREVLVTDKGGLFVVIGPANATAAATAGAGSVPGNVAEVGAVTQEALDGLRRSGRWRVAAGRPHSGAYGVARSYEEAREALQLAERLHLDAPVVYARDLLVYRVLVRDQAAMSDLVHAVLSPLLAARGGAQPLLDTLRTYFETGAVATETARRMHLSVRTVTYRLARVAELTGLNPADAQASLTLWVAVLGARLLGWPAPEASPAR